MPLPNAAPGRRESDAELQALFAAMSDVIRGLDAEGRYVKIAPTNAAPPYRPAPDLLGRTLHDVFPKAQADEFLGLIERALAWRQTVHAEYRLTIGGEEVWFAPPISPMDPDRVVLGAPDRTPPRRGRQELRPSQQSFCSPVEHPTPR